MNRTKKTQNINKYTYTHTHTCFCNNTTNNTDSFGFAVVQCSLWDRNVNFRSLPIHWKDTKEHECVLICTRCKSKDVATWVKNVSAWAKKCVCIEAPGLYFMKKERSLRENTTNSHTHTIRCKLTTVSVWTFISLVVRGEHPFETLYFSQFGQWMLMASLIPSPV